MHEIVTEIDLPASAARVWAALTDFASYRKWNPIIESIDGRASQGGQLRLKLRAEAFRELSLGAAGALEMLAFRTWCRLNGMRIAVRVTKLLPGRELRWAGGLPVPSLFEAEHFFLATERRDGGVRFTQGERYAGVLEPAFREAMEAFNRHAMTVVNHALKRRLEAPS
jgi:hypothetical protein